MPALYSAEDMIEKENVGKAAEHQRMIWMRDAAAISREPATDNEAMLAEAVEVLGEHVDQLIELVAYARNDLSDAELKVEELQAKIFRIKLATLALAEEVQKEE